MPSLGVLLAFVTSCVVLYTGWGWSTSRERTPYTWTKGTGSKKPNIVFILTDDQDLHMNSLDYMPHTQKFIADQGTTFKNHFCTNALCCPSRVTLWTGLSPHNTNVTDVNPPHGLYLVLVLVFALSSNWVTQVATLSSSREVSTRTTFLYGCSQPATTPTTSENSSTPRKLTITTSRTLPGSRDRTSCLIHSRMSI